MSFAEVYHIVIEASKSPEPARIMEGLRGVDMSDLREQEIALLYGVITKDMPCLSGYLPPEKRIIGSLILAGAIPSRTNRYR